MSATFHLNMLTAAERFVINRTAEGRPAEFPAADPKPLLRAAVLRQLLLGEIDPVSGRPWPILLPGVRIKGAALDDELDLRDTSSAGQGLSTLVLDECDIPQPIHLCATRIARLSIAGSRFRELCLNEAHVDGPLDFSGASSIDGVDGVAWIDARNALIAGQVSGAGAKLRAPAVRSLEDIDISERRAALWLKDAEIRGSVQLGNGFVAHGGVSLDTAHVRGDVRLTGAEVFAGEDDAFSAQNARIGGSLRLAGGFTAHGTVWLHGASINDELVLAGAILLGGIPASWRTGDKAPRLSAHNRALVADTTDIGSDCVLKGATASSRVSLRGCRIRGSIEAHGLTIGAGEELAFLGEDVEVSDGVAFVGARIAGSISLKGADIGSSLDFDGAMIGAPIANFMALDATNARIGADATFGQKKEFGKPETFYASGCLDMTGLQVRGNLTFGASALNNMSADGTHIVVRLERARIEGNLRFGSLGGYGDDQPSDFYAYGEINLSGASIGRDLLMRHATFHNPKRSAVYAKDVQVGDDLRLERTKAKGDLRFERADIAGSLKWNKLAIGPKRELEKQEKERGKLLQAPLEFRRARVGSALKAEELLTVSGSAIDLRGLRVYEVQDWKASGWGTDCEVDFDGMIYERITFHEDQEETKLNGRWKANDIPCARPFGPRYHTRGGLLLDWILRQPMPIEHSVYGAVSKRPDSHYFPQPFRQLARVLRAQGEEEAARFVNVCERWATPSSGLICVLRRRFFGPLFEFGFSPTRALIVVLIYWCAGTYGVWQAEHNRMLVETSMVASIVSMPEAPDATSNEPLHKHAFMGPAAKPPDTGELLCTDTAINWPSDAIYAADMIVPFIPLHQETKCEISAAKGWKAGSWRVAKAVYSVIGWLLVSITLATLAGVLKRNTVESE